MYSPVSFIAVWVNEGQTYITLETLDFFLKPKQLNGVDIWISKEYKIVITQACNGMIPILFLYASILAYPSRWREKIKWMFIGYVLFFVVNIVRILLVVYVTENGKGKGDFYWSHDFIGNVLLLTTGLGIFIAFIKSNTGKVRNL
jgi:exosortase/archaeosortase family protein